MIFGLRGEFEYFECGQCGCLQIGEMPGDVSKYYLQSYYSFRTSNSSGASSHSKLVASSVNKRVTEHRLHGRMLLAKLIEKAHATRVFFPYWLRKKEMGLSLTSKILDVGCGGGQLLLDLSTSGFSNLTGVDPFIDSDIFYGSGLRVFKKQLEDLNEEFDFVMLHHSFEHMPNPLKTLKEIYRLLRPRSYVLLRIPLAGSYAWRKYGINWAQLDAPRHLYLYTPENIRALAASAGFKYVDVLYDSTNFQFWASEQYLRGIPLMDDRSYFKNPSKSIFTLEQLTAFDALAADLNANGDGDQAAFYLYKA